MSASNREVKYLKSGVVIVKDRDFSVPPLDCPVCGYFMLKSQDLEFWHEYECCQECGVTWAEGPNKKKWKEGWRPDPKVISDEVKRRSRIVPRLNLNLE